MLESSLDLMPKRSTMGALLEVTGVGGAAGLVG